jgi:hypothetical protein
MHIQGPKGVLCTCMARTQFNIRPLLTEAKKNNKYTKYIFNMQQRFTLLFSESGQYQMKI